MDILKKADQAIDLLLRIICFVCFIGLFIILVANVFFRWVPILSYFPNFSMGWFDEIVELMFSWMVMSCSSLLCRYSDHFKVDLLQSKLQGKKVCYALEILINIATVVFFASLTYWGIKLTAGAVQTTPVLRMEKRWWYLCVPFNAVLMTLYTVRDLAQNLKKLFQ